MNKNSLVRSSCISASVTIFFVVCITIAGELYKVTDAAGKAVNPIKEFLKSLHGHHWVGKGIWAVVLFMLLTAILYTMTRKHEGDAHITCVLSVLTWLLYAGTAILFGFFTYEYLIAH